MLAFSIFQRPLSDLCACVRTTWCPQIHSCTSARLDPLPRRLCMCISCQLIAIMCACVLVVYTRLSLTSMSRRRSLVPFSFVSISLSQKQSSWHTHTQAGSGSGNWKDISSLCFASLQGKLRDSHSMRTRLQISQIVQLQRIPPVSCNVLVACVGISGKLQQRNLNFGFSDYFTENISNTIHTRPNANNTQNLRCARKHKKRSRKKWQDREYAMLVDLLECHNRTYIIFMPGQP